MNNLTYFLAFNRMSVGGPRIVRKLMQRWPDLKELFGLSAAELEKNKLPPALAASIAGFDFKKIEEDLQWAQKTGHHLLTWESPQYPPLLAEIHNPPIVLYARGKLSTLEKPALAMVGTRKPSVTGTENAYFFSKSLSKLGISITSGLALGIDAQAHQGCIDGKGSTIAVLGTGIDCIYPRRHSDLAEKILDNGLLLSEFPLKSPPIAGHFPRRNRIISGLSLATLVIEAAIRSGSLITARFALEQNRDVLAIPGSIHNPQSSGCHLLLQQGAKLITSVSDILEAMHLEGALEKPIPSMECTVTEPDLLQYMGYETTSIDQIMMRTRKDMETIICELAMLEIKGFVKAVAGGYMRCKL